MRSARDKGRPAYDLANSAMCTLNKDFYISVFCCNGDLKLLADPELTFSVLRGGVSPIYGFGYCRRKDFGPAMYAFGIASYRGLSDDDWRKVFREEKQISLWFDESGVGGFKRIEGGRI